LQVEIWRRLAGLDRTQLLIEDTSSAEKKFKQEPAISVTESDTIAQSGLGEIRSGLVEQRFQDRRLAPARRNEV
jgi:hypothetical protein